MRIIFLGTPQFAVKPLESIYQSRHEAVAVVTQPDRAKGRGKKVQPSPIKLFAQERGLEVLQFERIKEPAAIDKLRSYQADIMVSCAYGQIFSQEILELTPHGIINIHASLLPKYRGSSPVQWALINGETQVGITTMKTVMEVDKGDMILQKAIELEGWEDSQDTLDKLSPIGAELIVKTLDLIENGTAKFIKQDENKATYCKMLRKEDGKIDFNKSAKELVNFIRGMNPWPSSYINTQYGILKILQAEVTDFEDQNYLHGEVVVSSDKKGLIIKCGEGFLNIKRVQGQGGKEMDIKDYLRGKKIEKGIVL
ncbi:MAG: methionyl-tRNA formyltransferase [Bacillota bacterium]|jgi:methionyl-tRNA formyltransferase|nr:methionyl-tRNA formyltransferase [Bacillota bacterium]HHU43586.1 methionyl-tRNA formyltransferase [Clostridiales bacterium]